MSAENREEILGAGRRGGERGGGEGGTTYVRRERKRKGVRGEGEMVKGGEGGGRGWVTEEKEVGEGEIRVRVEGNGKEREGRGRGGRRCVFLTLLEGMKSPGGEKKIRKGKLGGNFQTQGDRT